MSFSQFFRNFFVQFLSKNFRSTILVRGFRALNFCLIFAAPLLFLFSSRFYFPIFFLFFVTRRVLCFIFPHFFVFIFTSFIFFFHSSHVSFIFFRFSFFHFIFLSFFLSPSHLLPLKKKKDGHLFKKRSTIIVDLGAPLLNQWQNPWVQENAAPWDFFRLNREKWPKFWGPI